MKSLFNLLAHYSLLLFPSYLLSFVKLPKKRKIKQIATPKKKKIIYILTKREAKFASSSSLSLSLCLLYPSKLVISDSHHSFWHRFHRFGDSSFLLTNPHFSLLIPLPALVRFPPSRRVKRRRVVPTKRSRKPAVSSAVRRRQRPIVHRPRRRIRQRLVRVSELNEVSVAVSLRWPLHRRIGMVELREAPVRRLDLRRRCVSLDSQHLVKARRRPLRIHRLSRDGADRGPPWKAGGAVDGGRETQRNSSGGEVQRWRHRKLNRTLRWGFLFPARGEIGMRYVRTVFGCWGKWCEGVYIEVKERERFSGTSVISHATRYGCVTVWGLLK